MTTVTQTWTEPSTLDKSTSDTLTETIWDAAMSNALYTGRICEPLFTNAGTVNIPLRSVVIIDTTIDYGMKMTTTASNSYVLGVALQTSAPSATARIANRGTVQVLVQGTVARGDWLVTSTTAGRAAAAASAGTASFGLAMTAFTGTQGTVVALLRI